MIRTLVWKEYREQRAVWAVMTAIAVAVLVLFGVLAKLGIGIPFLGPWQYEFWCVTALLLAALYGVVCAAMLLAGERESGTAVFLDSLASSRTSLWKTKIWAGAILIVTQAVLISLPLIYIQVPQAISFRLGREWFLPSGMLFVWDLGTIVALSLFALSAFAWTMLFSARGRTVLGALGYSVVSLCLIWLLAGAVFWLSGFSAFALIAAVVLGVLPGVAALFWSWWIYAGSDTERQSTGVGIPAWLTLLWLTACQARPLIVPLLLLAVVLGAALPWFGPVAWPLGTVLIGVICGIAVFGGEQGNGWRRFLGDQRLPPIWVLAVKTAFWLAVAVFASALAAASATACVHLAASGLWTGHSWLYEMGYADWVGWPAQLWYSSQSRELVAVIYYSGALAFWLSYGFVFGLVSTLVVRKPIVALLVALLFSSLFLCAWVPSLAAGGLAWWQLGGLPALGLVVSYLLMRAWASDRIYEGRALLGLGGGAALALSWMIGNFVYRAVQFPKLPPPFDIQAFQASLPKGNENEAGRLILEAANSLPEQEKLARGEVGPLLDPPFPGAEREAERYPEETSTNAAIGGQSPFSYHDQIGRALQKGWPTAKSDQLNRWLDTVCRGKWLKQVREAAALPLGVVQDSRLNYFPAALREQRRYADLAVVLAGRALQLQARGLPRAALDHLAWALNYSRNLRHKSVTLLYQVGTNAESTALTGLYQWLRHPGMDGRLLRQAAAELRRHIAELPPFEDSKKADYLVAAKTLADPSKVPAADIRYGEDPLSLQVAILADSVPWERERYQRLLNYLYAPPKGRDPDSRLALVRVFQDARLFQVFGLHYLAFETHSRGEMSVLRISELMIALVQYEADHAGRPAPSLASLVPDYLSEVPLDPTSVDAKHPGEQPFRYSISNGGWTLPSPTFTGEHELMRIPAGRGLIEPANPNGEGAYVVPAWPAKK